MRLVLHLALLGVAGLALATVGAAPDSRAADAKTVYNKADLIKSARDKEFVWEHQVEDPGTQKVRVHGDTAVVTARLWLKGTSGGKPIDKKLWFSDTYVRTPQGWRYFFGQASLSLPPSP